MTWLSFLNKRKVKRDGTSLKKAFFLKKPGTNLYVHPAGKHLFDNSAYSLQEGKVGAICVFEEQIQGFFQLFLEEASIQLATEEIIPNKIVS